MANSFLKSEKFPFMLRDEEIGELVVDYDKDGNYVFSLDLKSDLDNSKVPWSLTDLKRNFIDRSVGKLHNDLINDWLEERIFPPDRQNADELLARMGLSEYDLLDVSKYTRSYKRWDGYWFKAKPE